MRGNGAPSKGTREPRWKRGTEEDTPGQLEVQARVGGWTGRLRPGHGGPCMASLASRFYLEAVKGFDPSYGLVRARL